MENLRRLWPLALVGLAALLVSGPVALVLSDSESRSWTLRMFLEDANVGFVGYQVVFPALIAVMLFRYLDSTGKTNAIHALPVTRTALFASNALSGLVLVAVPQLLLTLSLLPFVRLGSHGFRIASSMGTATRSASITLMIRRLRSAISARCCGGCW